MLNIETKFECPECGEVLEVSCKSADINSVGDVESITIYIKPCKMCMVNNYNEGMEAGAR